MLAALSLSLVFGLGWGLGLLATSTRVIGITIGFQIAFTVVVGSQGLLLLVFHGFRSDKARQVWKQWLFFLICKRNKARRGKRSTTAGTSITLSSGLSRISRAKNTSTIGNSPPQAAESAREPAQLADL